MQVSSYRPVMRSGASSVSNVKRPDQTAQLAQNAAVKTANNKASQQLRSQVETQLLNKGNNINFDA